MKTSNLYCDELWKAVYKVYENCDEVNKNIYGPSTNETSFIESYMDFIWTNIQHIIVFMLPIILIGSILIFSLRLKIKSHRMLQMSHRRLKKECLHLSILIKRNESQIRIFKQYEAHYLQLLSIVKKTDEAMYVRLLYICNTHGIYFPTRLPHCNLDKNLI